MLKVIFIIQKNMKNYKKNLSISAKSRKFVEKINKNEEKRGKLRENSGVQMGLGYKKSTDCRRAAL